jgi:hypothetical protein
MSLLLYISARKKCKSFVQSHSTKTQFWNWEYLVEMWDLFQAVSRRDNTPNTWSILLSSQEKSTFNKNWQWKGFLFTRYGNKTCHEMWGKVDWGGLFPLHDWHEIGAPADKLFLLVSDFRYPRHIMLRDELTQKLIKVKMVFSFGYPRAELFGPGHFVGLGLGLGLKSEILTRTRT